MICFCTMSRRAVGMTRNTCQAHFCVELNGLHYFCMICLTVSEVLCGAPPQITGASWACGGFGINFVATYTCLSTFTLHAGSSQAVKTCTLIGHTAAWVGTDMQCDCKYQPVIIQQLIISIPTQRSNDI